MRRPVPLLLLLARPPAVGAWTWARIPPSRFGDDDRRAAYACIDKPTAVAILPDWAPHDAADEADALPALRRHRAFRRASSLLVGHLAGPEAANGALLHMSVDRGRFVCHLHVVHNVHETKTTIIRASIWKGDLCHSREYARLRRWYRERHPSWILCLDPAIAPHDRMDWTMSEEEVDMDDEEGGEVEEEEEDGEEEEEEEE